MTAPLMPSAARIPENLSRRLSVRIGDNFTGSSASTILPLPTIIATWPSISPGRPVLVALLRPQRRRPAPARTAEDSVPLREYAHRVRPLQSSPTPGVVPPQSYGSPNWVRACRTALAAIAFGAVAVLPSGSRTATPLRRRPLREPSSARRASSTVRDPRGPSRTLRSAAGSSARHRRRYPSRRRYPGRCQARGAVGAWAGCVGVARTVVCSSSARSSSTMPTASATIAASEITVRRHWAIQVRSSPARVPRSGRRSRCNRSWACVNCGPRVAPRAQLAGSVQRAIDGRDRRAVNPQRHLRRCRSIRPVPGVAVAADTFVRASCARPSATAGSTPDRRPSWTDQ